MVVIDFHGWMGMTQGNPTVGQYFNNKFGYGSTINQYSAGFFSAWAQAKLKNTRGLLVEYPKNTRSIAQCDNDDYVGKSYRGIMELLASKPGNGSGSGSGNSGSNSGTGDQPYSAKGTVINVTTVLNVRETPSTSAAVVDKLKSGQSVTIVAKSGSWYKISSPAVGYVHKDYIEINGEEAGGEVNVSNEELLVKLREATVNYLEEKGKKASKIKVNNLILRYFSCYKYSDKKWNILLGKLNSEYKKYIENIEGINEYIKAGDAKDFNLDSNEIDLRHLAATSLGYCSTIIKVPEFLGAYPVRTWTGWAGDLATFIYDVETNSEIKCSDVGTPNGASFGELDLFADIDAIFMGEHLKEKYIDELLIEYYKNKMYSNRKNIIVSHIEETANNLGFVMEKTLDKKIYAIMAKSLEADDPMRNYTLFSLANVNGVVNMNIVKESSIALANRINRL